MEMNNKTNKQKYHDKPRLKITENTTYLLVNWMLRVTSSAVQILWTILFKNVWSRVLEVCVRKNLIDKYMNYMY